MYRVDSGILPMNVSCIISNHKDHEKIANWHDIPFFIFQLIKIIKISQNKKQEKLLRILILI